jgi:hypothetical protein
MKAADYSFMQPTPDSSALGRIPILRFIAKWCPLVFVYTYHFLSSLSLPIHTANNWIALHL